MSKELEKITTQYRTFEQGQYIEHTQFNELLDSFEDQDRLSKVLLNGVGVVCGLQPTISENRNMITVSQGTAVTTDGDLLTLIRKVNESKMLVNDKVVYKYYQVYDNHRVKYKPFYKGGKQIELWELLESEATTKIEEKGVVRNIANLEDKYVILYLESYEKEVRPCKGVDCDNHGTEKISKLRVLLTNKEGIENIVSKDIVYREKDTRHLYKKLPEIALRRPVLSKDTDSFLEIVRLYSIVFNDQIVQKQLTDSFEKITSFFGKENALINTSINNAIGKFLRASGAYGFQYCYTFIKELINTYNEIKALLPKLTTICFPDFNAFSKHVMLGNVQINNDGEYRHDFYKSPIQEEKSILKQLELLIERFNMQVKSFSAFERGNDVLIKVTPSVKNNLLGNKAIPFYYKPDEEKRSYWDFKKSINRKSQNNLSYYPSTNLVASHIQNPLNYNQDHTSFYRVEGHQGKSYIEAFGFINSFKKENGLAFDIMLVSLAELDKNEDEVKAFYQDYIRKHSGLDHKSGVYKGGTFVLVYESEEKPIVFADFTLPYLCCSKKKKIVLELPVEAICYDSDSFAINLEPFNGEIKAFVGTKEINIIEKQGNQNYLNPSLVPTPNLNEIITFTVNDKTVDNEIIVHSLPEKTISTTIQYPEGDSTTVVVIYKGLLLGYEYEFDFYNNGKWEKITPDGSGNYVKSYLLKPGSDWKIQANVLIKNKKTDCTVYQIVPISLLQDIEIIDVSYPNGDCCDGLQIEDVIYGEKEICCITKGSKNEFCATPFIIRTNQNYSKAKGRYKLITSSVWKEFDLTNRGNMKTPDIYIAGTYNLEVKVMNENKEWTDWYTVTPFSIDECPNNAPTAKIAFLNGISSVVVKSGGSGTVNLTALGSSDPDPNGSIINYKWETRFENEARTSFGGSLQTTRSILTRVGKHYFRVQVQDNLKKWSTWSREIEFIVRSNQVPIAKIAFTNKLISGAIKKGEIIKLGLTAIGSADPDTGGSIAAYEWETCYGNENWLPYKTTTINNIEVSRTRGGIHYFQVRVKDNLGEWSSWSERLQFNLRIETPVFTINGKKTENLGFHSGESSTVGFTIVSSSPWRVLLNADKKAKLSPNKTTESGTNRVIASMNPNISRIVIKGNMTLINDEKEEILINYTQEAGLVDIGGGGIGGGGGSGCFDLESNILMTSGRSKKLKNIEVGDELVVYNFENKLSATNKELKVFTDLMKNVVKSKSKVVDFATKIVDEYREITLVNGEVLTITPSHPILASKNGEEVAWLLPDDVRSGVFLVDKNGEFVEIESKRTIHESLEIGLLQLESGDNYFVEGCMVHNVSIIRNLSRSSNERGAVILNPGEEVKK